MKAILYTMADGTVCLGRFMRENGGYSSGIERRRARGVALSDAIAAVAEKGKPEGALSWHIVRSTSLPGGAANGSYDKTFFEAFEDSGGVCRINMNKARAIHMRRIRRVRNARLVELDLPQQRALICKDETEALRIESEKQKLRDIPQTFDLNRAKTPDELKALWPGELA